MSRFVFFDFQLSGFSHTLRGMIVEETMHGESLFFAALIPALDTPIENAVTQADWLARLPVLAVIVIITLALTAAFAIPALRKARSNQP